MTLVERLAGALRNLALRGSDDTAARDTATREVITELRAIADQLEGELRPTPKRKNLT